MSWTKYTQKFINSEGIELEHTLAFSYGCAYIFVNLEPESIKISDDLFKYQNEPDKRIVIDDGEGVAALRELVTEQKYRLKFREYEGRELEYILIFDSNGNAFIFLNYEPETIITDDDLLHNFDDKHKNTNDRLIFDKNGFEAFKKLLNWKRGKND